MADLSIKTPFLVTAKDTVDFDVLLASYKQFWHGATDRLGHKRSDGQVPDLRYVEVSTEYPRRAIFYVHEVDAEAVARMIKDYGKLHTK